MALIKTDEEIARIQAVIADPRVDDCRVLSASFLTRPEQVRELLPPGLSPTERPLVTASVAWYGRSNFTGGFHLGALFVEARHEDQVGVYPAVLYTDTDAALVVGRDVLGEPKRLATFSMQREGSKLRGECTRYGTPILRIQARLEKGTPPPRMDLILFNYKYHLSADLKRLEWGPMLMALTYSSASISRLEAGTAELQLGQTAHDPWGELEVVELLGANYLEFDDFRGAIQPVGPVDARAFLPYALSRMDDLAALDNLSR